MNIVNGIIEEIKKRPKIYGAITVAALSYYYAFKKKGSRRTQTGENKGKDKERVGVNKQFFEQIKRFLPIIVPGMKSKEFFDLVAIAILLVFRSLLDVWMIKNNADIVSSIVALNYKRFVTHVVWEFGLMQFPTSLINNLLKYFISDLSLGLREKFSYHIHKKYMQGNIYYAVSNLDGRIENADQVITQDIMNFCNSFGNLYSHITKPVLDLVIFFVRLVLNFGWEGPTIMLAYFLLSGAVMTKLRTPFSKFSVEEGQLEGKYRFAHSRVITHSEEIAFYRGSEREKKFLDDSFSRLTKHLSKYYLFRLLLGFFDSCITKYSATLLAYFIVTAPIFSSKNSSRYDKSLGGDPNNITRDYTRYVRLLIAMVTALGTLIDSGRELSRFAGYTARVAKFMEVLRDMENKKYVRKQVLTKEKDSVEHPGDEKVEEKKHFSLENRKGKLIEIDHKVPTIKFIDVPIVTPNGDILVEKVNFTVEAGINVLIAGPNGCGKSSLFRLLGGLWPLFDGVIERPSGANLFYVPQRPYLTVGNLRDQVIYPHTSNEVTCSDEELLEIMGAVSLKYLLERDPKGWDAVHDWNDRLSGGEKQRIAMARLFYNKPQFAILDECTSAVSVDVEGDMYNFARKQNITLFTVSHRKSLWKYHEFKLHFDGLGGYEFTKINENEEGFGS